MTTKQDISVWAERGKAQGATHMIVVCDTFDWGDYPVFVTPTAERPLAAEVAAYSRDMQKVMEVYDLTADMAVQLNMHRARADLNPITADRGEILVSDMMRGSRRKDGTWVLRMMMGASSPQLDAMYEAHDAEYRV